MSRFSTAFYVNKNSPSGTYNYIVDGCTFRNNTATYGGAIYGSTRVATMNLTVQNSLFDKHTVVTSSDTTADGGCIAFALAFTNSININLYNNNFTNNMVYNDGGVLFYSSGNQNGAFQVSGNNFINNYAFNGANFYFQQLLSVNLSNNFYAYNQAENLGGSIYVGQGSAYEQYANYTYGHATSGGAIVVSQANYTLTNSSISYSSSVDDGGCISAIASPNLKIAFTTFSVRNETLEGEGGRETDRQTD